MNYKIFIDKEQKEEIIVYARESGDLVRKIEELLINEEFNLLGFSDAQAIKLNIENIFCFVTEKNKVYAIYENERFKVKYRIYQLEELLPDNFIKINQSTIANINLIEKFSASPYGTLCVKFKNGYTDYVSRRNIKKVKERFGL